jgi:hypothetical protein
LPDDFVGRHSAGADPDAAQDHRSGPIEAPRSTTIGSNSQSSGV